MANQSSVESFPYSERMSGAQQGDNNQDLEFLGFEIPDLNFDYSLHEINDTGFVCANSSDCHTVSSYNTTRDTDESVTDVVKLNVSGVVGTSVANAHTSCFHLSSYADLFSNEEQLLIGLL